MPAPAAAVIPSSSPLRSAPVSDAPAKDETAAWLKATRRKVYTWMSRGFEQVEAVNLCRLSSDVLRVAEKLLATKTFRSPFRRSVAGQLRDWLKERRHQYSTPFSPKQMRALTQWHRSE